jgi:hypothetical protein
MEGQIENDAMITCSTYFSTTKGKSPCMYNIEIDSTLSANVAIRRRSVMCLRYGNDHDPTKKKAELRPISNSTQNPSVGSTEAASLEEWKIG